jgi:hypothetical protein
MIIGLFDSEFLYCLQWPVKSYPCNRPWRSIVLWDVEAPTFSRPMVFNVGYTYSRGYAKISYGVRKIKTRNNPILFLDTHWIIRTRFRVSHRRPGCKDIRFTRIISLSLSPSWGVQSWKRNYISGFANKKKLNINVLDNRLTDGGKVVRLTRWPPFSRRKIPGTHFC